MNARIDLSDPAQLRAYQSGYASAANAWRKRLDDARRRARREALSAAAEAIPNYGFRLVLEGLADSHGRA